MILLRRKRLPSRHDTTLHTEQITCGRNERDGYRGSRRAILVSCQERRHFPRNPYAARAPISGLCFRFVPNLKD